MDWKHWERRIQFTDRLLALMTPRKLDPSRLLQPPSMEVAQRLEEVRTEEGASWVQHRPVFGHLRHCSVHRRLIVG